MKNLSFKRHYIFYIPEDLPKAQAHLVSSKNAVNLWLKDVLETSRIKVKAYVDIIKFLKQFYWENQAVKILSCVDKTLINQIIN